ncbi:FxLD family lanthipeptide [Actinoplanes sp. NBC_00393]|uniref:FxLD family lanthipeptide n=1 Tax=Actinoplanes sp. NBC_00393 TaxID=2975953 RepID=UPI002E1BC269
MAPLTTTVDRLTEPVTDDDFELDMRVVELTTTLMQGRCDTNDGCGSTCSTSACSTGSYDPV